MTSKEFRERVQKRAHHSGVALEPGALEPLETYFRLLVRWNAKINLTALPLNPPTEATIDRLLIEPLAAARIVANVSAFWLDLGSGGGSPAIPLKIARPLIRLTMVESKTRKAAFLREAIRCLGLTGAVVENVKYDELACRLDVAGRADLVTVRAVKTDAHLIAAAARMLKPAGRLLLFRSDDRAASLPGFVHVSTIPLIVTPSSSAYLATFERLFHVEQTG